MRLFASTQSLLSKRRKLTNDNQRIKFLIFLISIFELCVALMHLQIHSNSLYLPTHNDQKSDIIIYRKGWFSFVLAIGYQYFFLANLKHVRLFRGESVNIATRVKESLFETLTSRIIKQKKIKNQSKQIKGNFGINLEI